MRLNQLLERSVEDELGDGWRLWASLQDSSLIVFGIATDSFSLNHPGTSIEVQCKFEAQNPGSMMWSKLTVS